MGLTFGVHNGQKHVPVLRLGGHGRPEARRVRADPHFHGHGADKKAEEEVAMCEASKQRARAARAPRRWRWRASCAPAPRKLNLVAQSIRGLKAGAGAAPSSSSAASAIAHDVRKALYSAISNAENNHNLDIDRLVVAEADGRQVPGHEALPRPGAGPASRIEKPFSEPRIVVRERGRRPDGSEGQSGRASARHQPDLGFALVRRATIPQAPARGSQDPRASAEAPEPGRRQPRSSSSGRRRRPGSRSMPRGRAW